MLAAYYIAPSGGMVTTYHLLCSILQCCSYMIVHHRPRECETHRQATPEGTFMASLLNLLATLQGAKAAKHNKTVKGGKTIYRFQGQTPDNASLNPETRSVGPMKDKLLGRNQRLLPRPMTLTPPRSPAYASQYLSGCHARTLTMCEVSIVCTVSPV
jgi:hypothetical protein